MKDTQGANIRLYITLSILFITAVLGLTYVFQKPNSFDERGTFGDMFGFANALFTGMSVVGLIITIILQRDDLNRQQKQIEEQYKSNLIQNFETTFFNMINVHHQIVNSMHLIHQNTTNGVKVEHVKNARSVFLHLFGIIHKHMQGNGENFFNVYTDCYMPLNFHLDHYYNNLLQIIKFIDESEVIDKYLKNKYCAILSSQLSEHEKIMVFYHVIYINDDHKYKHLLEKYDILNNFNYDFMVPHVLAQQYKPVMN